MTRNGCPSLSQWFTGHWVAEELAQDALRGLGAVKICEPSCGDGAFLAAIPAELEAFGVDIDPIMVERARALTGRDVLLGDFRTVDLGGREAELVIGNPPFDYRLIDGFIARADAILPADGVVAMILPASSFRTGRVDRWSRRFSIEASLIPRTLFGRLRDALLWTKMRKGAPRTLVGLMLFHEQREVEEMNPRFRQALDRPGTWREVVRLALESLGGAGSLAAIYDQIIPERRSSRHWQPKVRQTLQLHYRSLGNGRWALDGQ